MGVPAPESWGRFADIPADEPFPGVHRRTFDSAGATVTQYRFDPGATFPIHHHPEEQVTLIEEGVVKFTVGQAVQTLSAGDWSVVAPDVEHGLQAGEGGARIVAIIVPRRQRPDAFNVVDRAGGSA